MSDNLKPIKAKKLVPVFGEAPVFEKPLPVGQMYFPEKERVREGFSKVFANKYYNNNGPLHEELEEKLQRMLGVKHALCVLNATLGLMIVSDCIETSTKTLIPSFTFVATLQSQLWRGTPVVLADVSLQDASLTITDELFEEAKSNALLMPVNLWGGCCKISDFDRLQDQTGASVVYDSAPAFGVEYDGKKLGGRGTAEVFSFHATKIINASEGGLITTNDDELAAKIRAKRPSYPSGSTVSDRVANSRFSEAQACLALLSLEDFDKNLASNKRQYDLYADGLAAIDGLSVWEPANCSQSNYSSLVVVINERTFGTTRNNLVAHLKAENVLARRYYYPGMHQIKLDQCAMRVLGSMANTDYFSCAAMQLPLGGLVSHEDIQKTCDMLWKIKQFYC